MRVSPGRRCGTIPIPSTGSRSAAMRPVHARAGRPARLPRPRYCALWRAGAPQRAHAWPGRSDRRPLQRDGHSLNPAKESCQTSPAKRTTGIHVLRAIAPFGIIRVVDRTGTVPYANNLVRKRSRSFRPSSKNGGTNAVSFMGSLGDSLTVEQWTLTPLVEVRILVPQPLSHLSHSDH